MSGKSFRNWAAGLTIAAAAGYMLVSGDSEPEAPPEEPRKEQVRPPQAAKPAPPAVLQPPPPPAAAQPPSVAQSWSKATTKDKEGVPTKPTWLGQARARNFFDKFKSEPDFIKKVEYLDYIFDALQNDIRNADVLGLQPKELSRLIRDTAYRGFQDMAMLPPPQTDLERLTRANDMRLAHLMIGLKDDGQKDEVYAEQMTGMTYESIDERKIEAAVPAAAEALTILRELDYQRLASPQAFQNLTDEQIQEYHTLFNLVQYVLESYAVNEQVEKRYGHTNKWTALSLSRSEWEQLRDEQQEALHALETVRLQRQFGAPESAPSIGR
ncbi:MAG: hypothetical protein KA099_00150 [Alphaproteobacteria bacterium]|nr:hypothetical protein [Alphaproteobacteria bacterium]MBP7758742.1 hypothetical protein [Alphaproteobacteria bacterium]MBP7761770.1 hypothetical protein [Alphaproteobacteria bacterium]MBP7903713.1 hypothetical protein [Alphaproteobacteria bacterium]